MIIFVLFCLAATDLVLVNVSGWGLTPFWVAYALALLKSGVGFNVYSWAVQAWISLFALFILIILSPFFSRGDIRVSSLFLSLAYTSFGFWLLSVSSRVTVSEMRFLFKSILTWYGISSFVALIIIQVGLPDSPLSFFAKSTFDVNSGVFRVHALSSEPSYAATVVATCCLGLLRLYPSNLKLGNTEVNRWLLVSFVLIILFGSVLGYFLFSIIIASVTNKRSVKIGIGVLLFFAIALKFISVDFRAFRIISGFLSGDINNLVEVDGSSYMRFGPLSHYLDAANLYDFSFWFGHGAASSSKFFGYAFGGLAGEGVDYIQVGFIPAFLYDYGLIAVVVFFVLSYWCCQGTHKLVAISFLVATMFNANFNTQMFWFVIAALVVSGFAVRRKEVHPK